MTVFDTLSGEDRAFIVMEYVRGRPMSDLISPGGMDSKRLMEILRPVASALDYAHEHGVVHRDVKPANILIGEDRWVKLVDLGTATAGHLTQITAENEVMGTLAYIAPERLSGESVGEPASDIYSLAVVAFESLTGRPPHRADTPGELLDKSMHDLPADPVEAWPDVSPKLARVLAQGMDPHPERRPHTAGGLTRDLEAGLSDRADGARPPTFAPTEPMTPPTANEPDFSPPEARPFEFEPSRRRRPTWLLPALALVCLLVAGGIWLAVSSGGGGNGSGTGGGRQAAAHKQASRSAGNAGTGEGSATESSAPSTTESTASTPPVAAAPTAPAPTSSSDAGTGAQLNARYLHRRKDALRTGVGLRMVCART